MPPTDLLDDHSRDYDAFVARDLRFLLTIFSIQSEVLDDPRIFLHLRFEFLIACNIVSM